MAHKVGIVVGFAVAMWGLGGQAVAAGDTLGGSRYEPSEVRHRVRVLLDRGYARFSVERTFYNPGERADQILLYLAVPPGGVATGLRTLGTLGGKPHWFEGEGCKSNADATLL